MAFLANRDFVVLLTLEIRGGTTPRGHDDRLTYNDRLIRAREIERACEARLIRIFAVVSSVQCVCIFWESSLRYNGPQIRVEAIVRDTRAEPRSVMPKTAGTADDR